jgi:hypoxanthine phosphoribosyltransferase
MLSHHQNARNNIMETNPLAYAGVDLELVYSKDEISRKVSLLGQEISQHYQKLLSPGQSLLAVGVLNGAFVFMADLVRSLSVPCDIDFIRLSSYQDQTTSSSQVVMLKNLEKDVAGRHVLIVEDIADVGLTLAWLVEHISVRLPASIKIAVCVDKRERRKAELNLDYVAFVCQGGFLVGYGLDCAGHYRHLDSIYALKEKL